MSSFGRHESTQEPEHKSSSGGGLAVSSKCDECGINTGQQRVRVRVLAGPLRGMRGMVCGKCVAAQVVPA